MSECTSLRELSAAELDIVSGGQGLLGTGLIGGPGSLIDIATTGTAVQGILGSLGSLLEGLMLTSSITGSSILGILGL